MVIRTTRRSCHFQGQGVDKANGKSTTFTKKTQSNLSVRTPLYYGLFPMSRHNSYKLSLKNYLYNTDFLNNNTDTKSRPQRLHSYRLNLSLLRTLRWSGESRIPIRLICMQKWESRLVDVLCKVISIAQSLCINRRFAKGVQRNIFIKLESTIDSIKIFSITCCTLVYIKCFLYLQNSERPGPIFTKRVALSYTLYWQIVPLSHTLQFTTLHPF